jgi:hypothetical protein
MLYVYLRRLTRIVLWACVLGAVPLLGQTRQADEGRREEWQKVDQIFTAMGVRPGATVADVECSLSTSTRALSRNFASGWRTTAFETCSW